MSTGSILSTQASAVPQRRSRSQLWLLVAVFFVPLGLSFLLYYGTDGWRPTGSTNHGDLLVPARALPAVSLSTPDGARLPEDFLRGKWSFVYAGASGCDDRCRAALTDMRQVRLALNKDSSRVQRVFLYAGSCCDDAYFAAEQSGLILAAVDNATGQDVIAALPVYDDRPVLDAGRIYVVDPLGNVMMSYAREANPKGLLDDMKKLLRLSQIG